MYARIIMLGKNKKMEDNPLDDGQSPEMQATTGNEATDLSVIGNPEIVDGEKFALRIVNGMPDNKAFAEFLDYSIEQTPDGWDVNVPTPDKLNEIRKNKLANTEANTAQFVTYEGGKISGREYLSFIANHQIPIGSEYMRHDFFHALGFTRLSEETFGLMAEASAKALASKDESEIGKMTELIDDLSASASITSFGKIPLEIPDEFVRGKIFSGVKKSQVEKRQVELDKELKSLFLAEDLQAAA